MKRSFLSFFAKFFFSSDNSIRKKAELLVSIFGENRKAFRHPKSVEEKNYFNHLHKIKSIVSLMKKRPIEFEASLKSSKFQIKKAFM